MSSRTKAPVVIDYQTSFTKLQISGTEEKQILSKTALATSNSLGNLAVLPREIRDHIYGFIISDRYRAHYTDSIVNDFNDAEFTNTAIPWGLYHKLGVIGTSRILGDEVSRILYKKARFCFQQYGISISPLERPLEPNMKLIERIMNIDLFVFMDYTRVQSDTENRLGDRKDPGPLTLFRDSAIPRKSAIIRIVSTTDIAFMWLLIHRSPFFNAIKCLVGFQSVILKTAYERTLHALSALPPEDAYSCIIGGGICQRDPTWRFLSVSKDVLEPCIGPSSDISRLVSPSGSSVWRDGCRQIEFHPRKYIANSRKTDKDVALSSEMS